MFQKISLIGLFITLLTSCQPEKQPTVTLISPTNNQHFKQGDTVHFLLQTKDYDLINSVKAKVYEEVNTNVKWNSNFAITNNNGVNDYKENWVVNTLDTVEYKIEQTTEAKDGSKYVNVMSLWMNQ